MTNPLRRRAARPAYVVTDWTSHYRVMPGGRIYRDAVVQLADGTRRLYAFPTEAAA